MTAVKVAGCYLALMVGPARLSCDYSYNAVTLFGWTLTASQDPHAWAALAVLLALIAGAVAAWRRDRAVWFLLGMAAVAYLPTSNLLVAIGTIMAERLTYPPLAAMTAAIALGIDAVGRRVCPVVEARHARRRRVVAAITALLLTGALTARTSARNADWTSDLRLWTSSASAAPDSIKIHRALASIVMESDPSGGRADEATAIATRGLRVLERAPLPLPHLPAALFEDLGVYHSVKARLLAGRGESGQARAVLGDAVRMFERAAEIDRAINRLGTERLLRRGLSESTVADTGTPSIYRNLGWAYPESGDAPKAEEALSYLRRIPPGDAESHYLVGVALGGESEADRARGDLHAANVQLGLAAVSLIEATLLDAGRDPAWEALERVSILLAPGSAAVVRAGGRRALNMEQPLVADHCREACVELVRQLSAAVLRDEADRWRRRMIGEFGLPADLFPRS